MKRLPCLALLLLISLPIYPEIAFTEIKGLYDPIPADKKQCSPVHGFNWWKTGVVENFWIFGDQASDTIKLIRDLFYLQADGVTFDATNLSRKPAKYFDAKTIGEIIRLIDQYKQPLSARELEALKTNLFDTLKRVLNFDQLVVQAQQRVASAKKDSSETEGAGKERQTLDRKIVVQERKLKTLMSSPEQNPQTEAQITQLKKEIAAANNRLETLKERLALKKNLARFVHNNDLNEPSLRALAGYIAGSVQETLQGKYVLYTTHQILLAFLWKKINEKSEFAHYFALTIPEMATQQGWLTQEYSKDDFVAFTNTLERNAFAVRSDYTLNSFVAFGNYMWNKTGLPLLISSIADSVYTHGDRKYIFPDCGETSLRNFINILIYSAQAGTLDFSMLEKTAQANGFVFSPALAAYYKNHANITKIQTKAYYNDWNSVVSGLSGVEYTNPPGYEISPAKGITNMLRVISHVLFNNDNSFNLMSNSAKLDYMVEKLSRPDFKLTWYATELNPADEQNETVIIEDEVEHADVNHQEINIKLIFTINEKYHFMWKFTPHHFVIVAPSTDQPAHDAVIGALASAIPVDTPEENIKNSNLLCWYARSSKFDAITSLLTVPATGEQTWDEERGEWVGGTQMEPPSFTPSLINNYLILVAMARDLRNHEILISLLDQLTTIPQLIEQHLVVIKNMINALPIKDPYYADQVGKLIIDNKVVLLYPLVRELPVDAQTIYAIVNSKNEEFYDLAAQKISEAYDNWPEVNIENQGDYLATFELPEFKNILEAPALQAQFAPILQINNWGNLIYRHNKAEYPRIQQELELVTSYTLSKQQDSQLYALIDILFHNEPEPVSTFFGMIIPIIKATKYKPTIEHIAEHTVEDKLEPLYAPLREAILANPDFYGLVIDIIKDKMAEWYPFVQEVAAKVTDKELLKKIAENIRFHQVQELLPLADKIEQKLKKEEQVVLTLPMFFNRIMEFAQNLFTAVTEFAFKS
jgi:hypothetical protein